MTEPIQVGANTTTRFVAESSTAKNLAVPRGGSLWISQLFRRASIVSISAFVTMVVFGLSLSKHFRPTWPSFHVTQMAYLPGVGSSLGVMSVAVLALANHLQRRLLSHLELHHFPLLIESSLKTKVGHRTLDNLPALSQNQYQPLHLFGKRQVSHNVWQFEFAFNSPNARSGLVAGQHVSVRACIAGKPVTRSYTPTSRPTERGKLTLTVKVYNDGVMGNYLKDTTIGSSVDFRGPLGTFKYRRNLTKKLVCVAAGSGITPIFQVIQQICLDGKDETDVVLLYANRTEKDVILKEELEGLQKIASPKFQIRHVISQPSPRPPKTLEQLSYALFAESLSENDQDVRYLICGPVGLTKELRQKLQDIARDSRVDLPPSRVHVF